MPLQRPRKPQSLLSINVNISISWSVCCGVIVSSLGSSSQVRVVRTTTSIGVGSTVRLPVPSSTDRTPVLSLANVRGLDALVPAEAEMVGDLRVMLARLAASTVANVHYVFQKFLNFF